MSSLHRWIDRNLFVSVRVFLCRQIPLLKFTLVTLLILTTILLVKYPIPIKKHKPSLRVPLLKNGIPLKDNTSTERSSRTSTRPTNPSVSIPLNYLDPFIYSRIEFTHDDQRRPETSRKWCSTQSKAIRPQDLEPFKCSTLGEVSDSDHLFCEDLLMRNSCLIMSFAIAHDQSNDPFINHLYDWGQCRIFTFDPYQPVRSANGSDVMFSLKPNWISYRLGLTASAAVDDHSNLMTIEKLSEVIHLESISARIDIMIIDIDNANEWSLLDDNDFFLYLCRHVKQLIVKTKPIYSKRFQHYRIYTMKLNRCFALLRRRSRLYLLGRHDRMESEWSLSNFSLNLGLFCDEIDMSMYLLVYGHFYLVNTKL